MLIRPDQLDFNQYKRFFAFGCSFTGYRWPTWAEILHSEMLECSFYNMGLSGAGNLAILSKCVEANLKLQYGKDDLVIILWSTYCREDRYSNGHWRCPGNIFTQDYYDKSFVEKHADPKGYLIRDLTLMSIGNAYLDKLPGHALSLRSVPFNYQNEQDDSVNAIIDLFQQSLGQMPPSLLELEYDLTRPFTPNGHSYFIETSFKKHDDYHPDPLRYRSFLEKIHCPLTDKSMEFTEIAQYRLKRTEYLHEIQQLFPNNTYGSQYFKEWW